MLHSPHRIGDIDVTVTVGDACPPKTMEQTRAPTPVTRKSPVDVAPNKADPRPEPRAHVPRKIYRILVKGLPLDIDAETLSIEFQWTLFDIVMDPHVHHASMSTQCWLKNPNSEKEVDEFIEEWNQGCIRDSIVTCVKEEDELELCNKFQFGQCKHSNNCYWVHERCTANGACSASCPYGHMPGEKSEDHCSQGK